MATWRPENSMLTQRGVEILNKLKAGVGSITVTRVVAGSGRVAESLLFQQTSISGVQKPMTISGKNTTDVGSEITFYIENKDFAEPYDLHQIGIYVTHPDYVGEQLYHISQCDANDYDTIPAISYTPVTQGYSIFMEHGNSSSVDITVDPSGMINTVQFNEFKESTNATIQRIKTDVVGLQNKTEYLSNQNLLINWDFGNPVDQRGGYVVPPGETYYTFDWVAAGTTDKYYPVLLRRDAASNYDCEIEIGGTRYVVAGSAAVRGYTGAGYTIDRWNCRIAETILITDDGIKVIASSSEGSYCQYLSTAKYQNVLNLLKGNTVTLSALFADGELITNTVTLPESVSKNTNFGIVEKSDGSCYIYLRWYTDGRLFFDVFSAPNRTNDYTLKAIKLELGSYQTLAHKDENGNWVLNEVPNYHEEFLKCIQSTADAADAYANKVIYHTGNKPTPADIGAYSKTEADKLLAGKASILTSNIGIYVSTTGSDTTGDGSSGKPFRTIQHAIDSIPPVLNGNGVSIIVAAGTYDEDIVIEGKCASRGYRPISIEGASSKEEAVNYKVRSIYIAGTGMACVTIRGFKFTGASNGSADFCSYGDSCVYLFYCIMDSASRHGIFIGDRPYSHVCIGESTISNKTKSAILTEFGNIVQVLRCNGKNNAAVFNVNGEQGFGGIIFDCGSNSISGTVLEVKGYGGQIFK